MGWSIVPDQSDLQWKTLLPKAVADSEPNISVNRSERTLLVTQDLWLERHKTPRRFSLCLEAVRFSEWYMSSGLALQSLEVLAQKSNVSRSFISLWSGKVALLLSDVRGCSAWHCLPVKDTFVAVQHLLPNKASFLSYDLKFLTMLLSSARLH